VDSSYLEARGHIIAAVLRRTKLVVVDCDAMARDGVACARDSAAELGLHVRHYRHCGEIPIVPFQITLTSCVFGVAEIGFFDAS